MSNKSAGGLSAETDVKDEYMTQTTDGRPLAAVQPSIQTSQEYQSSELSSPRQRFGGSISRLEEEERSFCGYGLPKYEMSFLCSETGDSVAGPSPADKYAQAITAVPWRTTVPSQSEKGTSGTSSIPKQEIDILLIGKTGHGKSSTGNSILQRQEFQTSSKGSSATYNVHVAWSTIGNYMIKVVDGPGVAETRLEGAKAAQKACDDMAKAMTMCPKGFHALLLVLKFGERFTKEEEDCVALLKSIFGQNIVQDYCVIVVTHGELFDMDDDYDDFSEWLLDQDGALKKLFIECKYRCILMSNKTKDNKVKETQLKELLQTIHTLTNREVRYTNELFKSVQQGRDRLIVEVKAPELKEGIMRAINLIVSDLSKLKMNDDDFDNIDDILLQMDETVKDLLDRIAAEDNHTGALIDVKDTVSSVQQSIQTEKAINARRKEDRKAQDQLTMEHEERMEKLKLRHAEEQRKLNEQYQNASEAEKEKLIKQLHTIDRQYKKKMDDMKSSQKQSLHQAKLESERLQNLLIQTKKDYDLQINQLHSQYKEMEKKTAETVRQTVSEKLMKMNRNKPPPKDPTKVTLHCKDTTNRHVSVSIPKNSPIKPLMDAYYAISNHQPGEVRFYFDDVSILPENTPSQLNLEEDDMLEVLLWQDGGFYTIRHRFD